VARLGSFVKKVSSSVKSGGSDGQGSIVTSMSDLEKIEKLMNQAKYANKSIVKYFGKYFEDFRRDMQYSKEIILTEY
jgi:hypothetical protein